MASCSRSVVSHPLWFLAFIKTDRGRMGLDCYRRPPVPASMLCTAGSLGACAEVYPRDGVWTLRWLHEALIACQEHEETRGAYPLRAAEGGFAWPAGDEQPDAGEGGPVAVVGNDDASQRTEWRQSVSGGPQHTEHSVWKQQPQVRAVGCRSPVMDEGSSSWREEMPLRPDFDRDIGFHHMYYGGGGRQHRLGRCILFRAEGCPTFSTFHRLLCVLENLGHVILSTHGFEIMDDGSPVLDLGATHHPSRPTILCAWPVGSNALWWP